MNHGMGWFHWALLSACFAALTAIFAKLGLQRVDSDFATLIRTVVIVVALAAFVAATGKLSNPLALPPSTLGFLVLSALARSEEHTSELQSLMRISYAVFCWTKQT